MIFATLSRPGAMGITWEERGEYTIITRIEAGSQASEHPELRIGLRLMNLDGSEIMGLDFSEALDLLRGAGRPVTLGLWDGQGPNPLSMELWYATRCAQVSEGAAAAPAAAAATPQLQPEDQSSSGLSSDSAQSQQEDAQAAASTAASGSEAPHVAAKAAAKAAALPSYSECGCMVFGTQSNGGVNRLCEERTQIGERCYMYTCTSHNRSLPAQQNVRG